MSDQVKDNRLTDEAKEIDAEIERLLASLKKQNEILARELEDRGITTTRNQKAKKQ